MISYFALSRQLVEDSNWNSSAPFIYFTSAVVLNVEDLCGEFSITTINLIFKKINPNLLGFGKTFY